MPRPIKWRALWPGVALAAALVLAVAWVFVYARVGAIRGATYRLFTATNEARGVLKGTEVWLAGQKVGVVSGIAFRPVSTDTLERVMLELQVLKRHRALIRRDSHVQIRPGGTLIGQPVVFVSTGTIDASILEPGDTIAALPQGDTESLVSEMARVGRVFPALAANAKAIRDQLMIVSGVARSEDAAEPMELEVLRTRAERLTRAAQGDGSIGLMLRGGRGGTDALDARMKSIRASADTLISLLASERTTLGRFRRDTTLAQQVAGLRAEVAELRALASTPVGTVGRARLDDAASLELAELERRLAALIDDIKRRPQRYLHF